MQGHIDIGPALYRGKQADRAVALQKRQGEEEPCDELAADIAGENILAGRQLSCDGKAVFLLIKIQFLLCADILVDTERSCKKSPAAGQADFLPAEQAGGNHKTKSASAFPAGQNCRMREFHGIDSADDHAGVFAGDFSAECPEAVQRGQNILGKVYIGDHAGACGQARTDKQAVCHALGGWCLDSATSL